MSSPGETPRPGTPQRGSRASRGSTATAERDVSRDDLLSYLSRNTLDEDYALVHSRRTPATARPRRPGWVTAGALALFALLVVTLFTQTTRSNGSEQAERRDLIGQVQDQQRALAARRAEVSRLQRANADLRERYVSGTRGGDALLARVRRLGLVSGTAAATGPGVLVVADDAPGADQDQDRVLDSDLQKLVNGLWEAGAEAMSVNGERLTNLSSIRAAGEAINVNFVGLTAPYRLQVIGDPDTLASRFAETTDGATWFDLQRRVGLRLDIEPRSALHLPTAERTTLRYATAVPEGDHS